MSLTETNAATFWTKLWENGETGWKNFEEMADFSTNVFASLQQGPVDALAALGIRVDAADRDATIASCTKGRRVLVPLCGDTGALRFFLDSGASEVIGVELVRDAVERSISQWFPTADGWTFASEETAAGVTVLSGTNSAAGRGRVVFYCGDLFVAGPMFEGTVDVVYDRASMVAMHPSTRGQYTKAVGSAFRRDGPGLLFLQRVERPAEGVGQGPPFHLPSQDVASAYASSGFHAAPYWEVSIEGTKSPPVFTFLHSACLMSRTAGDPQAS